MLKINNLTLKVLLRNFGKIWGGGGITDFSGRVEKT